MGIQQVRNAIQFSCLAGSHLSQERSSALAAIDRYSGSSSNNNSSNNSRNGIKRYIILLTSTAHHSYRGLYAIYTGDIPSQQQLAQGLIQQVGIHKISGKG